MGRSNGDFSNEESVWVTNRNGGTHTVPESYVFEDSVGNVFVNDRGGFRYATQDEINAAEEGNLPVDVDPNEMSTGDLPLNAQADVNVNQPTPRPESAEEQREQSKRAEEVKPAKK